MDFSARQGTRHAAWRDPNRQRTLGWAGDSGDGLPGRSSSWPPRRAGPAPRRRTAGAQAKAASLARYVPREGLAGYLEFDGLDAHRPPGRARRPTSCSTRRGSAPSIEDIVRQLIAMSQAPIQPADLIGGFKQVARQGLAVGLWGKDPEDLHFVTVLRGGGRPELRRLIDMATQAGRPAMRAREGRPHDPPDQRRPPGGSRRTTSS